MASRKVIFDPTKRANEKPLEKLLTKGIESKGGLCIKLFSKTFTGLPDRMVMLPGPRICYVEMKSTGKTQSERQKLVAAQFRNLGFPVYVLDTKEQVLQFLELC